MCDDQPPHTRSVRWTEAEAGLIETLLRRFMHLVAHTLVGCAHFFGWTVWPAGDCAISTSSLIFDAN